MVVYVVWDGDNMLGIFSTYEKAEAFLKENEPDLYKSDCWGIDEWEVDS